MAPLTLTSTYTPNETSIPNIFLDTIMPTANGEFVKVYLCLMRLLCGPKCENISLTAIADLLNHTESDVIRAVKYWEKAGLLSVDYKGDTPVRITLLPVTRYNPSPEHGADALPEAAGSSGVHSEDAATADSEGESAAKHSYSATELKRLKENEDIRQIFYVAEQLLGKTITNSEMNTILYIYNDLHFSDELLEYLFEYCVSNEKRSLRYIEKVAIAWHQEGIATVEQAKNCHEIHSRKVFSVMRAFGIDDRKPCKPELNYISRWYDDLGFECEIIIEACNRTIQSLHKPSFEYADTILSNWKKNNVHTMSDIEAIDKNRPKREYRGSADAGPGTSPAGSRTVSRSSNNRFNNFTQRSYDFDALEKQLINRNN